MPPLVDATASSRGVLGEAPSVSSSLEEQVRPDKGDEHPVAPDTSATDDPSAKEETPENHLEKSQKLAGTISKHSAVSMEWVSSYFLDNTRSCIDPVAPSNGGDGCADGLSKAESKAESNYTLDAHFRQSDFLRAHWNEAAEYIPPVGFAMVAGGLCALHPVVIVGGALTACTAFGAVHAAKNVDGNVCGMFSPGGGTIAVVVEEDAAENDVLVTDLEKKTKKQDQDGVSEVTYSLASMEDSDESVLPEVPEVIEPDVISEAPHSPRHKDPSTLETQEEVMEWVDTMYPPLAHQNVDGLEISGLNAEEFFEVFLSNDAPFSFLEFQKKRKDKDIRYGQWEDLAGVTQLSLMHNANSIGSQASPPFMRERVLNFDAKTNNGLMGPPYATTTKVQRCLLASKRLLVLEGKTTVKGVPFCDRFHVMERWMVTSEKKDDHYVSILKVSCQVVYSKSCTFESFITSKSQESITEIVHQWNDMAQTALKRTEEARQERLSREGDQDNTAPSTAYDETVGIEVERAGPKQARIAGISGIISPDGRPPAGPPRQQGGSEKIGRSVRRQIGRILKRTKSS